MYPANIPMRIRLQDSGMKWLIKMPTVEWNTDAATNNLGKNGLEVINKLEGLLN